MVNLENRLKALEVQLQSEVNAGIWVHMFDNKVRIDIANKRGEELVFPSVFQAAQWVEGRMKQYEKVAGTAFISDINTLLSEVPYVWTPDEEVNEKSVFMILGKRGSTNNLRDLALPIWVDNRRCQRRAESLGRTELPALPEK